MNKGMAKLFAVCLEIIIIPLIHGIGLVAQGKGRSTICAGIGEQGCFLDGR